LYLWLIAPRLLPDRELPLQDSSARLFNARLLLPDQSPAVGKTLLEANGLCGGDMKVVRVRRGNNFIMPFPDVVLQAGDRLRVRDTPANLKAFESALKAQLYSGETRVDEEHPLSAENQILAEIAVVAEKHYDPSS